MAWASRAAGVEAILVLPRKAIIALARKLLIVAWRMLLTGEVYRAAKAAAVARKQRELQKKLIGSIRSPQRYCPAIPWA